MTSTIHADKIMNSSGDQDSGLDLLVNDQVKLKTANTDRVTITDTTTGAGSVSNADLLPTGLSIPVLFIPANVSTIPASTPGTIINIVNPEVTIVSVGTVPPPTIPLNSLTPAVFNNTPTTLTVADIANSGNLTNTSCF